MDNGSASWEQVHRTLFPGGPVPASLINVTNAGANSGAGILGPGPMGRPPFGLQQNAAFTPANSMQGGISPPPLPANTPLRPGAPPHKKDDNFFFAAPPPVPRDPKMLHHIKLFAAFVAKFGSETEVLARTKQQGRSELSFLYGGDPGTEASIGLKYYEWQKEVMLKVLEARKAVSEGKIPPDRLKSMQRELEQYLNGVQTLKDFRLEAIIGLPENGKLDWHKIALELGIPLPGEKRPQQVEASEKDKKSKPAVRPEVEASSEPPSRDPRKNGKNDRSRGAGRRDDPDTSNDRRGRRDETHAPDRRSRRDDPDSNDRRGRREDLDPRRHRSRSRSQERGGHRHRSRSPHRSPRRSRSPRRHGRSDSRSPPPHRHRDRLSPRRGIERKREGEERKDEKLTLHLPLDPTLPNQHMLPSQQPPPPPPATVAGPPHLLHHHHHHPPQLVPPQATLEQHPGFVPADNSLGRYISVLESAVGVPGTYSQVGVPFAPPTLSEIPVQQQQILLQQLQLSQMQNLNVGPPPPPPPPPQHSQQEAAAASIMSLPLVPPPAGVPPQQFIGLGSQAVELSSMFNQQQQEQVVSASEKYDFLRPASPSNDVEMEVASPPKADDTSEVVSSRNQAGGAANGSGNGKSVGGGTGGEGEGEKKHKESNKEDDCSEDNVQKGKSEKDNRALKVVRNTVAEFVKELLNPKWREGILSKDDFKVIAQKAVNKVVGNLQGSQIPKGTERVDRFMASSKEKITKLVQEYVEKHTKSAPPAAATGSAPSADPSASAPPPATPTAAAAT